MPEVAKEIIILRLVLKHGIRGPIDDFSEFRTTCRKTCISLLGPLRLHLRCNNNLIPRRSLHPLIRLIHLEIENCGKCRASRTCASSRVSVIPRSLVSPHLEQVSLKSPTHHSAQSLCHIPRLRLILDEYPSSLIDRLPTTLTHLVLGVDRIGTSRFFNQPLDHLPSSLTHLTVGFHFNQPVRCLPTTLTHLTLGNCFNQLVDQLPSSLLRLVLGNRFNQPVDQLPSRLTHLTFGSDFNQPVDRLPGALIHLEFGADFNQSIDHLPSSLLHLKLGFQFNQAIDCLPPQLSDLYISPSSSSFNQPIDHLPASIQRLSLGNAFNQPVDHLPASLNELNCGSAFNQPVDRLPSALVRLSLGCSFNQPVDALPSALTHFSVCLSSHPDYAQPVPRFSLFDQPVNSLPSSLSHLSLGFFFNHSLDRLPASCRHLEFMGNYRSHLAHLSSSVDTLILNNPSDSIDSSPLAGLLLCPLGSLTWPTTTGHLRRLCLNLPIVQPLDHPFPASVEYLELGPDFDQSLDGWLPSNLAQLTLRSIRYAHPLRQVPASLTHLRVHRHVWIGSLEPEAGAWKNRVSVTMFPSIIRPTGWGS